MAEHAQEYEDLLFNIRRSIRYHNRRRRYYQNLNNNILFFVLLVNSASVAAVSTEVAHRLPLWGVLLIGVAVSAVVVFGIITGATQKGWLHLDLARQFIDLEKALLVDGRDEHEHVIEVTNKMLEVEASEPPVLQVLDTICYNDLMRAMGYKQEQLIKVGWFQRACANLFDWRPHTLAQE